MSNLDRKIVSDFGEIILVSPIDDPTVGELWLGPPGTSESPRLVEAIRQGKVTFGGLAEAGWRNIGPWAKRA